MTRRGDDLDPDAETEAGPGHPDDQCDGLHEGAVADATPYNLVEHRVERRNVRRQGPADETDQQGRYDSHQTDERRRRDEPAPDPRR